MTAPTPPDVTFTDEELLTTLVGIEHVAPPDLIKGYIASVLKNMSRAEYLAFIRQVERLR